jgi:hypothetical protein
MTDEYHKSERKHEHVQEALFNLNSFQSALLDPKRDQSKFS